MGQPKLKGDHHQKGHGNQKTEIVCFCNNVPRHVIEKAIREGSDTLNKIFDTTAAGVGPCGGSCRRKLAPMLDSFAKTGSFPEILPIDMTGKKKHG